MFFNESEVQVQTTSPHAKLRVAIQFYLESRSDNQITLQEAVCVYPIHPVFVFFKRLLFTHTAQYHC